MVLLVVIFGVLEKTGVTNLISNSKNPGPTVQELQQETDTNANNKQEFIEGEQKPNGSTDTGSPAASSKSISLTAQKESNGSVTVFTKLPGYSSGTCNLTVTNGSSSVNQTAQLMYQPEYSSCAGFSVAINSLGSGEWSIKLDVTSGSTTESKTITYEVN